MRHAPTLAQTARPTEEQAGGGRGPANRQSPSRPQSRCVAALEDVEGEAVEVFQDVMHLVSGFFPAAPGVLAGRSAGAQRPYTARLAAVGFSGWRGCGVAVSVLRADRVAARLPAGEAFCLARQVVEGRGECGEPLAKACGIDRVAGRWQAAGHDGKPRGNAGHRDTWHAVGDRAAGAGFPTWEPIEKRQGEGADGGLRLCSAPPPPSTFALWASVDRSAVLLPFERERIQVVPAMPLILSCEAGEGDHAERGGGGGTTMLRAATMTSRRTADSAGRNSRSTAVWR